MAMKKGLRPGPRPWLVPRATAKRTPPAPCIIKRPSQSSNSTFDDDPFLPCADAAAKDELEIGFKETPDKKIGSFVNAKKEVKHCTRDASASVEAESSRTLKACQRKKRGGSLINFIVNDCSSDVDGLQENGDATGKSVSVTQVSGEDTLMDVAEDAIGRDKEEVKEDVKKGIESPLKEEGGMGEVLEWQRTSKMEIFVGGLDMNVKEEVIRKLFQKMGEIVQLTLVKDDLTGTNKGYALVRYSSADDAKRVLEKYTKIEISGRKCATAPVEGNILLSNIDKKWKNEDVIKLLKEIGIERIEKVSVIMDPNNVGHNLGYGFVELQTCKDAQNACNCQNLQKKLDKLQKVNVKAFLLKPVLEKFDEKFSSPIIKQKSEVPQCGNKPNQPRNNGKTPRKNDKRKSDILDYKTAEAVRKVRQQAHWMEWQKKFGSGPVVALQPCFLPTWNHPFSERGGDHMHSYHPGYINMLQLYPQRCYNPPLIDSRGYTHRHLASSLPVPSTSAIPHGDGLLPPPSYQHQGGRRPYYGASYQRNRY